MGPHCLGSESVARHQVYVDCIGFISKTESAELFGVRLHPRWGRSQITNRLAGVLGMRWKWSWGTCVSFAIWRSFWVRIGVGPLTTIPEEVVTVTEFCCEVFSFVTDFFIHPLSVD